METEQIEINDDDESAITIFGLRDNGTVQVWFEGPDGECSHEFTVGKWERLDKLVRRKFAGG
jgi:hypothetical protein